MKLTDLLVTVISYLRQPKKRDFIKEAWKLRGCVGIEVGGPSAFFGLKSSFPIYLFAKRIDGVNFSTKTVWEGNLEQGETYKYYPNKIGTQYIAEATDLLGVPGDRYNFLLSCHSLEHVANPIKALNEWKRVMKKGATLLLVLPDKRYTFDVNRPYTSFQHLVEDYNSGIDEHDTTHFQEILSLHEFQKDRGIKNQLELQTKLDDNYSKRTAHHHVFSQEVVRQTLEYCGFTVLHQQEADLLHLVTLAKK